MNAFNTSQEKHLFREKLADAIATGTFGKLATEISPYIKLRVYENSVVSAILRVRSVTPQELIPEEGSNDTFFVYGQLDQTTPGSVSINFRGQSADAYRAGRRFKIPLGRHTTETTVKSKDEMLAWDYDLFADFNEKEIMSLYTLRDQKFLWAVQKSVITSGKWKEYALTGSATVVRADKLHFNDLGNILESGTRTGVPNVDTLLLTKYLMSRTVFKDLNLWESEGAGTNLVGEVTINGYVAQSILGVTYISSLKNNLYVEQDPVTLITFSGVSVADKTIVVDGVTFTAKAEPSGLYQYDVKGTAAAQATEVATVLAAAGLGANYVITNPSEGVVRIRKVYDANWGRFGSTFNNMTVTTNETNATATSGYDIWDHIYGFPDPDYIGEIVQILGQEIETDIWKERDERQEVIKRRSSEWSGGAIGNYNAPAMVRLQRYKFTG